MNPSSPQVTPQEEAARLADAIATGDTATLSAWHDGAHPRLMRVATAVVGDRGVSAEIVQSAFVRAIQRLATFRGDSRLSTWLSRITERLALNELRRQRRSAARLVRLDDVSDRPSNTEAPDPFRAARVRAAVDALPESLRLPLLLTDIEGYTHNEVAKRLGITPGASRTRAARARNILRVQLADLAQPEDSP